MAQTAGIPFLQPRVPSGAISTGWMPLDEVALAAARDPLGLPIATAGYRLIVTDGVLYVLTAKNEHGWTVAVTHTQGGALGDLVPGRLPTIDELRAACESFVDDPYAIMAALTEPLSQNLQERINRTGDAVTGPTAPGLSTTVRCVQVFVEGITDDVVYGVAPA